MTRGQCRSIAVGVAVAACVASPIVARAQSVTVGIGGVLSAPTGGYLVAPVYADMRGMPGTKLGSYTIRVTWDPTQLYYDFGYTSDSVVTGTFAQPVVRSDSAGSGVLIVAGVSAQGRDSVVDLFRLPFYVSGSASSPITLQVQEMSAAGAPFMDLLPKVANPNVSATFCPALGRWGDLDADGASNSRDALAILSGDVGATLDTTIFKLALGDVDGDGAVNSRDALIILSYAVGLQIPGQRVLLVAPGACAAAATPTLTILPDTADLVVTQSAQLRVYARGSGGDPTAVTGVNWSVTDGRVAVVDPTGLLYASDSGTTTVTASLGPGVSVTGVVRVRTRRPVWYVNAQQAARASIQLGTQRYPFATPEFAFPLVSEGDTVRIAPGIQDYLLGSSTQVPVGIVVIGDTLADGTRPVLRAPANQGYYGFYWSGGLHGEVNNVVMRGFYAAAYPAGLRTLVFRNVRVESIGNSYSYQYGIDAESYVDTVIVMNSQFVGDTGSNYGGGVYVDNGAGLLSVQNSTFLNLKSVTIDAYDVDSVDLRGNEIAFGTSEGIYLYNSRSGAPKLRGTLSRNYIHDMNSDGLYASGIGSLALDHNVIVSGLGDAIDVYGTGAAGEVLTMRGDSVDYSTNGGDWLYAYNLGYVALDSVVLQNKATPSYAYGDIFAHGARVTNSTFRNVYYEPLYAQVDSMVVDRSSFTGCPTCGASAYTIWMNPFSGPGPKYSVTNSRFTRVAYAVYSSTSYTQAGPVVISGNRVDSAQTGFFVYADGLTLTDDTLTNVLSNGMWLYPTYTTGVPAQRATVARNQISCQSASITYAVRVYDAPSNVDDNVLTNCAIGVYASNSASYPLVDDSIRRNTIVADSVVRYYGVEAIGKVRPTIRKNHVRSGAYGLYLSPSDTATVTVDSNVVSQAYTAGMYLGATGPMVGHWNNVDSNRAYGVLTGGGSQPVTLRAGRFVGNASYSLYNGGANTILADSNWWGKSTGPGTAGADSVFGTATVTPYSTSDPLGTSVPAAPVFGFPLFAMPSRTPSAAPRTPVASTGASVPAASEAERRAERTTRIAEHDARRARRAAARDQLREAVRQHAPPEPRLGPPPTNAPRP